MMAMPMISATYLNTSMNKGISKMHESKHNNKSPVTTIWIQQSLNLVKLHIPITIKVPS